MITQVNVIDVIMKEKSKNYDKISVVVEVVLPILNPLMTEPSFSLPMVVDKICNTFNIREEDVWIKEFKTIIQFNRDPDLEAEA